MIQAIFLVYCFIFGMVLNRISLDYHPIQRIILVACSVIIHYKLGETLMKFLNNNI